jgi:hypothetical protein
MRPLVTMALALALGVLAGCGSPDPATGGGPGAASEQLAAMTVAGTDVLGPGGWRGLKLGMSAPRAIATGLLGRRTGPPTPCQQWSTMRSPVIGKVFVSQRLGVAAIFPAQGATVHTPEGMTIGWTLDQVGRAYGEVPAAIQGGGFRFVATPGNARARYRVGFDQGERVSALSLELAVQDCYD